MTNEKARDFFSAYFEGYLEPGLCVSFEQKLKADPNLRSEYDSFVRAMGSLDVLKQEEIEIPSDLHDRISAKLDLHIYERKRAARPAWTTWLKGLAYSGVAAAAIVGAIFAMNGRGGVSQAGLTPEIPKDQMTFTVADSGVMLSFNPVSPKTVVVTDEKGKVMSSTLVGDSANPELKTKLTNSLPGASVFGVEVSGDQDKNFIVVPGNKRSGVNHGEGSILELAKALADYYRVTVSLKTPSDSEQVEWTFASSEPVSEAGKALGSTYTVTLLSSGMLEIKKT